MSLKDLNYKPRRVTVRVLFDDTLRQELEDARAAYATQQKIEKQPGQGLDSKLVELQVQIDAAEAAADEAAVSFTFQALPRHKLSQLIAACPPTSMQLERWKEEDRNAPLLRVPSPEFDYERLPPLLIAASLVEPETTEAEVLEMWESGAWSDAIWDVLWTTAWTKVNKGVSTLPTIGTGSKKT